MAVWEWVQQTSKYCDGCKKLPTHSHTDCQSCTNKGPEIAPENREFFSFWGSVNTQWRTNMDGPIGLDYSAVLQVADLLNIDVSPAMLHKLQLIEQTILAEKGSDKHGS